MDSSLNSSMRPEKKLNSTRLTGTGVSCGRATRRQGTAHTSWRLLQNTPQAYSFGGERTLKGQLIRFHQF